MESIRETSILGECEFFIHRHYPFETARVFAKFMISKSQMQIFRNLKTDFCQLQNILSPKNLHDQSRFILNNIKKIICVFTGKSNKLI